MYLVPKSDPCCTLLVLSDSLCILEHCEIFFFSGEGFCSSIELNSKGKVDVGKDFPVCSKRDFSPNESFANEICNLSTENIY